MDIVSYKYELFGKEDETLKILAVGDIVGENGVKKIKRRIA